MRGALRGFVVAGGLVAAACGVPEQKYKAALAEQQAALKDADDQKARADAGDKKLAGCNKLTGDLQGRADACERRAADLSARLTELEQAASAATADAAKQRELAAQLSKTRELLEVEKAAAAAEAAQQRALVSQLSRSKEQLEADKAALERKSAEYEALTSSLEGEIKNGRIQVSELQGKVTVRLAERVLFPSGSATLAKDGLVALRKIADAFKGVKGRIIRVEGHTDNVPIRTDRFPSNWELSAARAIAVVRVLQERGVDPALLGAAGYAQYQPIAANDSAEGRAQNRRIEISLAAPLAALPEAKPAP
jgi:chemotaxis protein MotB